MRAGDLHITPLLQSRSGGTCRDTVAEYARRMKGGDQFPPLVAYKITDRSFKKPALVSGFHRFDAYDKAGVESFEVEVREGTFAEAWLAGWLSNDKHGLKHTNADKRKAAETALKMWREDSAAVIAERIAVSDEFVRKVRKELVATGQLEETETTRARDGKSYPATVTQPKKPDVQGPTVGPCDAENDEIPEETASLPFGDSEPEPDEPDADPEQPAPVEPPKKPAPAPVLDADEDPHNPAPDPRFMPNAMEAATFAAQFANWIPRLRAVHTEIKKALPDRNHVLAKRIDAVGFLATLKELIDTLDGNVPDRVCPVCVGTGTEDGKTCKFCDGYGIVDKGHHSGLKAKWKHTRTRLTELRGAA